MYKPASEVPAMLTITDIAGLVKGAAEGAGLGNAFLSHIKAVDGIYHVCRGFLDKDVTHVEDSVDPVRDLEIIHKELRNKDIEQCKNYITSNKGMIEKKLGGKEKLAEFTCIQTVLAKLEEGIDVRACDWESKEIDVLNMMQFLTAKPMIYLVNISKKAYLAKGNKFLPLIHEFVEKRGCGDLVIPFSVTFEQEAFDAEASGGMKAKQEFLKSNGTRSMIPKIIKTGYTGLHLIHYL